MKSKIITEKELMQVLPEWGSYAEEWGDDPSEMLIKIEWYPEDPDIIYIRDVTGGYSYTLEEVVRTEDPEAFRKLMLLLEGKENGKGSCAVPGKD